MGVCNCSMFCCTLLLVPFSFAIILMGMSWLLCLICLPGVSWWLSRSSSRCHGVVCSLWLWYFLIILTYYSWTYHLSSNFKPPRTAQHTNTSTTWLPQWTFMWNAAYNYNKWYYENIWQKRTNRPCNFGLFKGHRHSPPPQIITQIRPLWHKRKKLIPGSRHSSWKDNNKW